MDHCVDTAIFGFEAGMASALEGIPMSVRMKLDLCGLKISLAQWRGLPLAVRQVMTEVRSDTVAEIQRARRYFRFIVGAFGLGQPAPVRVNALEWSAQGRTPAIVVSAMQALGLPRIGAATWAGLSDLERFALVKLTRQGHVRYLKGAVEEFGLVTRRVRPSAFARGGSK
jgi:hypothetical protein